MPLQHTIFLAINIFPGHLGLFDFDLQRYFMRQAKLMKKVQINDTPRLNIKYHGMIKIAVYLCSYCSELTFHISSSVNSSISEIYETDLFNATLQKVLYRQHPFTEEKQLS